MSTTYQYIVQITTEEDLSPIKDPFIEVLRETTNQLDCLCQGVIRKIDIIPNPNNPINK